MKMEMLKTEWLCGGGVINLELILMERNVVNNTNIIKCQMETRLNMSQKYKLKL